MQPDPRPRPRPTSTDTAHAVDLWEALYDYPARPGVLRPILRGERLA